MMQFKAWFLLLFLSVEANDFSTGPVQVKAVTKNIDEKLQMIVNFTVEPYERIRIRWKPERNRTFKFCNKTRICQIECYWFSSYNFRVKISKDQFSAYRYLGNWTIKAKKTIYQLGKLTDMNISATSSETLSVCYADYDNYDRIVAGNASLYRITYKSEWDETAKNVITTEREIVLRNLVPYTIYTIDVEAKLNRSIYWNEKLTRKRRTLPSAPYAGPQSTNGSFFETTCAKKSKRCLILYWAVSRTFSILRRIILRCQKHDDLTKNRKRLWNMIPLSLRNGILDGFVIKQDGKILKQTSRLFARINNQPKNKDLWFEIRAKMNDSLYSPPTVIRIPSQGPDKLKDLTVVHMNNTHFHISWALQQPLKNPMVTVMSCLGYNPGSILWCYSNVKWTRIKNKNFTILEAVDGTLFAASISNLENSSSLTLAECVFTQGIAQTPQQAIISKKYPTQVNLLWPTYKCADLNGKPILFQVFYAEQNNCASGLEMNISALGTKPERENIEIKNLKPFTNYLICLRIYTVQGWSEMSPQLTTLTPETNPSDRVTNLQVVSSDKSSVTLKWDPVLQPNGIITFYVIDYQRSGGMRHRKSTETSNTAIVSGLRPLSEYTFSVSACNSAGCSNKSAEISVPLVESPFVTDLQVAPITESQLEIRWKLPAFLRNYLRYYVLEVMYGTKVLRYNETEEIHRTSVLCGSDDSVFVTVNVAVVVGYEDTLLHGDTKKISQEMCSKSELNLGLIIALPIICTSMIFIICGYAIKWMYEKYKETDFNLIYPNVVKDPPYYTEVDLGFPKKLMDYKSVHLISTDAEEEEEQNTETTILENDDDSKADISTISFRQNKASINQEKNERNLRKKLSPANLDPNSYRHADIKYSDCNSQGFDSISLLFELELAHLDSNSDPRSQVNNSIDSSKLQESNVDSEHYVHHDLSNTSQTSSDSNSLTCNHIALSNLSQTHGYVQNNLTTFGLKLGNLDSDSYIENNMESFSSNQTDLKPHVYVQNSTKSCGTNQGDLEMDGFLKKKK